MTEVISIRKMIAALFMGLVLSLAFGATIVSAADFVVVNATNVNVRSEPNTKSKSYGKVKKGTTLARSEARADGWSEVAYNGVPAYIKTEFLAPTTAPDAATQAALAQQMALVPNAASVTGAAAATALQSGGAAATSTVLSQPVAKSSSGVMVWIPQKGKKYHSRSGCSNMNNPVQVTVDEALSMGYTPCKKCY